MAEASFRVTQDQQRRPHVKLLGQWSLRVLSNNFAQLQESLQPYYADIKTQWDLNDIEQLDAAGAATLLSGWGNQVNESVSLKPEHLELFNELIAIGKPKVKKAEFDWLAPFDNTGKSVIYVWQHCKDFLRLLISLLVEIIYLLRRPKDFPLREFSANVYKSGVNALPVTALLGFMIGVVMGYLMSKQLQTFGADVYIVNILGISVIRELGPVLMAVLVAGRSGSAMTAQIGVMRVTDEIDALTAMGISRTLRVVLPKVLGLMFVAPLLVLWTSSWTLFGGAFASNIELGISYRFFFDFLPFVVQPINLTMSLLKGLMFGSVVALVACHFGLRVRPNTESLSSSTTSSVVTAISGVILVNAIFAILTRGVGV
ncbi:MAG TPA: ABC transporter permease [Methylophilaceae bacterium]|nr:ABC transporter permease [Methylophilaceae bacterium]